MTKEKPATPAATVTRQKSQETILKQEIRKLGRELAANQKKEAAFKTLQAEMATMTATIAAIEQRLQTAKSALIKELGLA